QWTLRLRNSGFRLSGQESTRKVVTSLRREIPTTTLSTAAWVFSASLLSQLELSNQRTGTNSTTRPATTRTVKDTPILTGLLQRFVTGLDLRSRRSPSLVL